MNIPFLIAGALALLGGAVHTYGGEYTLRRTATEAFPSLPNGSPAIAKAELRFVWHMVTIDLFFFGGLLFLLGFGTLSADYGKLVTALFVLYSFPIALLPLLTLRTPMTLLRAPQWILTLAIASLAWIGANA